MTQETQCRLASSTVSFETRRTHLPPWESKVTFLDELVRSRFTCGKAVLVSARIRPVERITDVRIRPDTSRYPMTISGGDKGQEEIRARRR